MDRNFKTRKAHQVLMALTAFLLVNEGIKAWTSTPSVEEIIARVPSKTEAAIKFDYDKKLLSTIRALEAKGEKLPDAVRKSHGIVWKEISKDFPKSKNWAGEEYVVLKHYFNRMNESVDKKSKADINWWITTHLPKEMKSEYRLGFKENLEKATAAPVKMVGHVRAIPAPVKELEK